MSTAQPPPSGAFSTAGEEAITRTVEINESELTSAQIQDADLDDLFEIVETAQAIKDGGYKQVRIRLISRVYRRLTNVGRLGRV